MNYKKYFLLSLLVFAGMPVVAEDETPENRQPSIEDKIREKHENEKKTLLEKQKIIEEKKKAIETKLKKDEQAVKEYVQQMQKEEQMSEGLALKRFDEKPFQIALWYVITGVNQNALTEVFSEKETTLKELLKTKYIQLAGKAWENAFHYYINEAYGPSKFLEKKNKINAEYDTTKELQELKERYIKEELPKAKAIYDTIFSELQNNIQECNNDTNSVKNALTKEGKKKRCNAILNCPCSKDEYENLEKEFVDELVVRLRAAGFPVLKEEAKNIFAPLSEKVQAEEVIKGKYILCGLEIDQIEEE